MQAPGEPTIERAHTAPAELRRLPAAEARALLLARLRADAAAFLGLASDADVAPTTSFIDLGFDSLRAVDFKTSLERELGCELRTTALFDHPTPAELAAHLADLLGLADEAAAGAGAAPARRPRERREPIAVVGLACRFPGAPDAEAFWRLQDEGRDAIGEVPADRWPAELLADRALGAPPSTRYGGFLPRIDLFDARFFGIAPREALQLDPQQRFLLEVAWEALEDARIPATAWRGREVGVFVGLRSSEYFDSQCDRTLEDADAYYATGNALSTAAGRISYVLGLTGPSLAIDTACSASLVAVHAALQSLALGECDAALAGGVSLILDPITSLSLAKASMLAADGRCKTFDAAADGYGRAEGCGMLVLKRLSDALADGDEVQALILGSAVNQDGASGGLTVPSGAAQERVLRAALADAGLAPQAVDYVEAHGTGTSLGDPIELAALQAVFGPGRPAERPLLVGSVKTNVGHLETAAGVAGLIKLILALRAERLPRHLHLARPNPHVPWAELALRVTTAPVPWPRHARPRVAGVSSFGFSGTNAHVLLGEPPAAAEPPPARERPAELLALSAASDAALDALLARYAALLDGSASLRDLARAAARGRAQLPRRAFVVAADRERARARLEELRSGAPASGARRARVPSSPPRIAFLFTGQGAQAAGMGRELFAHDAAFRETLERCDALLRPHLAPPLLSLLWGEHAARLSRTDATQPALVAYEIALAAAWARRGVRPSWVLGHSVGEIAAAHVAGVLSLEDALALAAARGRLMVEHAAPGAMLAVAAERELVREVLAQVPAEVVLSAENGPRSQVLSGAPRTLDAVALELETRGARTRRLDVSHAFHSPAMAPVLAPLARLAGGLVFAPPRVAFFSNLDPGRADAQVATPEYWVRHVSEPVRFESGMRALDAEAPDVYLELGPAPILLGLARGFLPEAGRAWIPSQRPRAEPYAALLEALGELWLRGVELDWRGEHPERRCGPAALPTYPFQGERYWLTRSGPPTRAATRRSDAALGWPGRRAVHLGARAQAFELESELSARSPAFVGDHCVLGRVVVPAALWLETARYAAEQALGAPPELLDVAFTSPLVLEADPRAVHTLLEPGAAPGEFVFRSASRAGADGWNDHALGRARAADASEPGPAFDADAKARCAEELDASAFYAAHAAAGLDYGPAFRAVRALRRGADEVCARLELPGDAAAAAAVSGVEPVLLDAAFQCAGALDATSGSTYLPVGLERLRLFAPGFRAALCHLRLRPGGDERLRVVDVVLWSAEGAPLAEARGLKLVRVSRALFDASAAEAELFYAVEWRPQPLTPPAPAATDQRARSIVLLDDGTGLAARLEERLVARGRAVRRLPPNALSGLGRDALRGAGAVVHLATADGEPSAARRAALCLEFWATLAALRAAGADERAEPARLWLVTRGAQAVGDAPQPLALDPAALWGLAASAALEHPEHAPWRVDLDPDGERAPGASARELEHLEAELLARSPEDRVALRAGERFVARLVRRRRRAENALTLLPPGTPSRLALSEYGSFDGLRLEPLERRAPRAGEVEVEIAAAGLNFKDALGVLGLLPGFDARPGNRSAAELPLGFEGAGRIVAVGPDAPAAPGLALGDQVLVCMPRTLRTHVTVPVGALAPLPADAEPTAYAGLVTVYLTALYSLERLAQLAPGETVLVHAAAGGVGQAALAVARRRGARVIATASRPKHAFLRAQGIHDVFDSRQPGFADAVLRCTDGKGADVVLNTLTGELVAESLRACAARGRFVELGKLDVWDAARVARERPDVRFHSFDLGELFDETPALKAELLGVLAAGLRDGTLPHLPQRVFALEQARTAFRLLAQGRSVGKFVLRFPSAVASAAGGAGEPGAGLKLRADRTYVISGGLGALGRVVAERLALRGARELLLLGRNAASAGRDEATQRWLAGLAEQGTRARVAAVDVADAPALEAVLERARREGPPLGGVVHAAGVLDDALLADLDAERLARVLAPKAEGAWNLHVLTRADPLEHFVLFSSLAAPLGSAGQAAYAAANAFLDALAHARRASGLPALALDFGPWAGAGMAARAGERNRARLEAAGLSPLAPERGAAAFERALGEDAAQLLVAELDGPRYVAAWPASVPPFLQGLGAAPEARPEQDLLAALAAAAPAERLPLLSRHVAAELARVLGFERAEEIDPSVRFVDLGVDSLLALDLKNRLERSLAVTLSATLLFDHPTPAALAADLAARLAPAPVDEALLEELARLPEDEAERLLSLAESEE